MDKAKVDKATAPVTVVVPCFRCGATIGTAVASVAAQTLPPAEVLLVDDCSGDGTLGVLKEIAAQYPSGWIRVIPLRPNGGPARARNEGWNQATQEFVAFLDADDSWHPRKLEIQMAVFRQEPSLQLLAHRMNVQPAGAPPPQVQPPVMARRIGRAAILFHNPCPTASVILRRTLPLRFDESRRRAEDYFLWAQIVLSGYPSAKVNQILASWHKPSFGAGGLSGDLDAMYRAAVDARAALYAQRLMSTSQYACASVVGAARHVRRRVITWLRRLGNKEVNRAEMIR